MIPTSRAKQILFICQALILAFSIASCSWEEPSPSVTIGTGEVSGNYRAVGTAIARVINQNQETHGFRVDDKTSAGSVANIDAILAGDIEFGIAQADYQYQALNGLGAWEVKGPQNDLRSVLSLYTEAVTLVAGSDSGVRTFGDLRGKRIDIGLPGSGTRQNAIDAFNAGEIDWERDIEAYEEKTDIRLAKLMHSKLDAFFYTVGHPNTDIKFATYSVRGARFIPLANIDEILSTNPYYSRSFIPIAEYPRADNQKDVETVGVKATLLTSASVPDEIVYAVTKAVFDELESLGEYEPVFKTFAKEDMVEGLTARMHPGAVRYYREIGLQVPTSLR
jgi:TRAP transporter TAXI family solute receptor